MTTTPRSTATTIQIRRGASTALSISYDYTGLAISTLAREKLQSLIDQAITQWWSGLTPSMKFAFSVPGLSLKISASCLRLP